jgi:hypothetical protein
VTESLTDEELQTLKAAAFGAVYLVANADPGFFAVLRESFAASDAFADSTGLVKQVLTGGGLPKLPSDAESFVLPALRRSVRILSAKAPEELENYRHTVELTVDRVAGAADGVSVQETAMIDKVKAALRG